MRADAIYKVSLVPGVTPNMSLQYMAQFKVVCILGQAPAGEASWILHCINRDVKFPPGSSFLGILSCKNKFFLACVRQGISESFLEGSVLPLGDGSGPADSVLMLHH